MKKKTSLNIEETLWQRIKLFCVTKGISISSYVEKVLKENINKNEIR